MSSCVTAVNQKKWDFFLSRTVIISFLSLAIHLFSYIVNVVFMFKLCSWIRDLYVRFWKVLTHRKMLVLDILSREQRKIKCFGICSAQVFTAVYFLLELYVSR